DAHASWSKQAGGRTGAICAAIAASEAGKCADDTGRGDRTNGVVIRVSHIDITRAIHRQANRKKETRGATGAIGAAAFPSEAGKSAHNSRRRYLADRVVTRVSYIDITRAIH